MRVKPHERDNRNPVGNVAWIRRSLLPASLAAVVVVVLVVIVVTDVVLDCVLAFVRETALFRSCGDDADDRYSLLRRWFRLRIVTFLLSPMIIV
jgi:hypothetical protein